MKNITKQRTLVIGDIHGRLIALKQVLTRSNFNYQNDRLIILGDICDGGEDVKGCIDELLKIKHRILILGNHDQWFIDWFKGGNIENIWYHQGGIWTLKSYNNKRENVPITHQEFFNEAKLYKIIDRMLFVHGGINPHLPIKAQKIFDMMWDRDLINFAMKQKIPKYKHVFIGHTTTQIMGKYWNIKNCLEPQTFNNLTMVDTGSGWDGRLTIIDINSKEFWQSDIQKPNI